MRCNRPIEVVANKVTTYCQLEAGHAGDCPKPVKDGVTNTISLPSRRYKLPEEKK